MAKMQKSGRTEIGMLADMRAVAEQVGGKVLGFPIRWSNEERNKTTGKKPDVIIVKDSTGEPLACGEAKVPTVAKGVTATVASEVEDALAKAKQENAPLAVTTNFLDIALHDARGQGPWMHKLIGTPITLIDPSVATTEDWWKRLTTPQLKALLEPGLREFFIRVKSALASTQPPSTATDINEVVLAIFKRSTDRLVTDLAPELSCSFTENRLPDDVINWAKLRGMDLNKPDEARYLAAQAVAEVLTSGLFYRNIQSFFALKPLLRGGNPNTNSRLQSTVEKSLAEAMKMSGDYETIFTLSAGASWALGVDHSVVLSQWLNLIGTLDAVNFEDVKAEVVGVIFERLISTDQRREMGQHYTQSRIARAMTTWAVTDATATVADFACGAGTFLVEAYTLLRNMGLSHENALDQVFGNDLDSFATHLVTINLATRDVYKGHNFPAVSTRDAFSLRPGDTIVDVTPADGDRVEIDLPIVKLTAVVGNPPYDEKAPDPAVIISALTKLAGAPVEPKNLPDTVNFAAWFILLAAQWTDGRIALVLPSSILQNEKHETLRRWLRRKYDVTIWHTESDVWFSDARVSSFVLLADPRKYKNGSYGKLHYVAVLQPPTGELADVGGTPVPGLGVTVRNISTAKPDEDPLIAGSYPDPLTAFKDAPGSTTAPALGMDVFRGNKLGSPLYRLRDMNPASQGVVREVEGKELRLKLHRKYLTPMLRSPKDEATGEFVAEGSVWWILSAPQKVPAGGDLKKYIDFLKRTRAADAPSVKQKGATWWAVDWKRSRIALQAHPQFQHQVWWADKPFIATDNFQALSCPRGMTTEDQELVAASLASAYGALCGLFVSHEVGCEGVRWVATDHVTLWPVLDPSTIDADGRATVLDAYRAHRKLKVSKSHEMTDAAVASWTTLTAAVADAAGVPEPATAGVAAVKCAADTTAVRREREKLALRGRTRMGSSGGQAMARSVRDYVNQHTAVDQIVADLTAGSHERKLRRAAKAGEQTTLDLGIDMVGEVTPEEDRTAAVLGRDFHCAPNITAWTADAVEGLRRDLLVHFMPPGPDGGIAPGYEGAAQEVQSIAVKTLQRSVNGRLT